MCENRLNDVSYQKNIFPQVNQQQVAEVPKYKASSQIRVNAGKSSNCFDIDKSLHYDVLG